MVYDRQPRGLTLTYQQQAGLIDWEPHLHNDLTKVAKSWRISDHYPLGARFKLP
jgi:hypothetical protein